LDRDAVPGFSLKRWLDDHLREELHQGDFGDLLAALEQGHGSVYIRKINVKSVAVDDVRVVREGRLLVSASAEASSELGITVDWMDLQHEDVQVIFGPPEPEDEGAAHISTDITQDA